MNNYQRATEFLRNPMNKMETFGRYQFEYRYLGAFWGFEVMATSPEDAKARVKEISWAQYKGEIAATIPVPGGSWLRRLFRRSL